MIVGNCPVAWSLLPFRLLFAIRLVYNLGSFTLRLAPPTVFVSLPRLLIFYLLPRLHYFFSQLLGKKERTSETSGRKKGRKEGKKESKYAMRSGEVFLLSC